MFYFISYLNSSTLFFKLINNYFTLNLHIDCSVALTSLSYYGLRCEHGSSADSVLFLNLGVKLKYVAEKDWTTGQNGEIGKIPTSESNVQSIPSLLDFNSQNIGNHNQMSVSTVWKLYKSLKMIDTSSCFHYCKQLGFVYLKSFLWQSLFNFS